MVYCAATGGLAYVLARAPARSLGQPAGLFVLAATEMWERFSYYGMIALLVLFLVHRHGFTDTQAITVFGNYTALSVGATLGGGWVADKVLGARKAVLAGAGFMLIGHLGLACESYASDREALVIFQISLGALAVGVGLLKPNITAIVGRLYATDEAPLRETGFTLFQMGIMLGALAAALACGWAGQKWGWAYGFGLAALGLCTGLVVFIAGRHHLGVHGSPPDTTGLRARMPLGVNVEVAVYTTAALGAVVIALVVRSTLAVGLLMLVMALGGAWGLATIVMRDCTVVERRRLAALMMLLGWVGMFALLIAPNGSAVILFAQRHVARTLGDWTVPAAQFKGLVPLTVIVCAPFFAWLWPTLARRGRNPGTLSKLAVSLGLMALALALLYHAAMKGSTYVHMGWLAVALGVMGVADVFWCTAGCNAVVTLAPVRLQGLMLGFYQFAIACGNYLASGLARLLLAGRTVADNAAGAPLEAYAHLFGALALIAASATVSILLLSPVVARLAGNVDGR